MLIHLSVEVGFIVLLMMLLKLTLFFGFNLVSLRVFFDQELPDIKFLGTTELGAIGVIEGGTGGLRKDIYAFGR
jgi:hypothetical protein